MESENSSVYPDYNEDSDIIENISDINMGALSGENPPAPPSYKINETQKSTIAEKMMSICKSLMEMSRELNSSLIIKENWLPSERDLQENIKEIIEENIIEQYLYEMDMVIKEEIERKLHIIEDSLEDWDIL